MAWVRGHYRRTSRGLVRVRGHARSSPGDVVALVVLGGIGAIVYGIYLVVEAVAEFVAANWIPIVVSLSILAAVVVTCLVLWRVQVHRRRSGLQRFVDGANGLVNDPKSTPEAWARLEELRRLTEPVPESITAQFPASYRHMVAIVVDDGHVDADEVARLNAAERALGLSPDVVAATRRDGFLEVFRAAVADGVLIDEEQQSLDQVRNALDVPKVTIERELALVDELVEARAVQDGPLQAVSTQIKLQKREQCFYWTEATERKKTIARSSVVGGVRMKEYAYEAVRNGKLHVTNQRILFVAEGTTTLKHPTVLDLQVDADERLLVITKDGRKSPYYFEVAKPHVMAAHINRALREGDGPAASGERRAS